MMPAPKFPQYKTVPTASLIPYVRNARTHSPAQVDKIAASTDSIVARGNATDTD